MRKTVKQFAIFGVAEFIFFMCGRVTADSSILYDKNVAPGVWSTYPGSPLYEGGGRSRTLLLKCKGGFQYTPDGEEIEIPDEGNVKDKDANIVDIEIKDSSGNSVGGYIPGGSNPSNLHPNKTPTVTSTGMVKRSISGRAVFNEPGPMCTITVPNYHMARLHVRLLSVSSNFLDGRYHYLLFKDGHNEVDQISIGNEEANIATGHDRPISIYPRINTSRQPSRIYEPVKEGELVTSHVDVWGENSIPKSGEMDFGAVYRLEIKCQPLESM